MEAAQGWGRPSRQPCRFFARGMCQLGRHCRFSHVGKLPRLCRYFQGGACFFGDQCSYQHLQVPVTPPGGCRSSEPPCILAPPLLALGPRASAPDPQSAGLVGEAGGERPGNRQDEEEEKEEAQRQQLPSLPCCLQSPQCPRLQPPPPHLPSEPELPEGNVAGPGSDDSEGDGVVCGICMERVLGKLRPEERLFGILPNCPHPFCLSCIRAWRRRRGDFPASVVKSCPQCRVHSSYLIPHDQWVEETSEKELLVQSFTARTRLIPCKFFLRGRGRCPFDATCIYLHQPRPPGARPRSRGSPPWSPPPALEPPGPDENSLLDQCTVALALLWHGDPSRPQALLASSSSSPPPSEGHVPVISPVAPAGPWPM
ncbi:probable E3 ubiquitin-protein ligase makorin-1 isoform X2 [Ornithorhynchus anatinus]|uniref:probable E3 ubiquitin-protein ligase makorin-1 isoform X2 n=1 Tax=Ornithorhynchus anatinus TaxID=9258 RepID=UPI0010A7D14C|nr:probable E3 ubiquitin-protein ligase makorin-1 isoform X2 [Ornithorhynchus anatinus]